MLVVELTPRTIESLPVIPGIPESSPEGNNPFAESDLILAAWRQEDGFKNGVGKRWDAGSRAIVGGWNEREANDAVTSARQAVNGAIADTAPYPVEHRAAEAPDPRSEADIYRTWVLRDHGIEDPEALNLREYANAYQQLSGTAYKELREDRPRWQRLIGWRRGQDKREAVKSAEYLLLGEKADDWFKPDISLVAREGSMKQRVERFAQRVSEFGPLPVLQHGLDTLLAKFEASKHRGVAFELGVTAASAAVLYAAARGVEMAVDFGVNFQNELQADLSEALMPPQKY